ncbi:MAG: hypothetical protein M1819_003876 [Sarea resinae]|nr:MAG: hypothetical protein M1819_003876 [Sarea resinae]
MEHGLLPELMRNRRSAELLPIEQSSTVPQAPWTTARCQRLLRPLASRILLLRKAGRENYTASQRIKNSAAAAGQDIGTSIANDKLGTTTEGSPVDPDWVPDRRVPKKLKFKYSGRSNEQILQQKGNAPASVGSRQAPPSRPGEVTVPTPMIARTMSEETQDIDTNSTLDEFGPLHKETKSSRRGDHPNPILRDMKTAIPPTRWALINGIYTGLDTLLKATKPVSIRDSPKGARSLFSTCVKIVPDYITAVELWQTEQDHDSRDDAASEVYSDLESFGASGTAGWKPLRGVVRAQGISLLGRAIIEGLIDEEFGRGLVMLCIQCVSYDEAEELLSCLNSRYCRLPKPSSVGSALFAPTTSGSLHTLQRYAERTNRVGFFYRELEKLLRDGSIPIEWLATRDVNPVWVRVIQSISQNDGQSAHATSFLRTAVELSCNIPCTETLEAQIHSLRLQHSQIRSCGRLPSFMFQEPSNPRGPKNKHTLEKFGAFPLAGAGTSKLIDALGNTISSLFTILVAIADVHSRVFMAHPGRQSGITPLIWETLQGLAFAVGQAVQLDSILPPTSNEFGGRAHALLNRTVLLANALLPELPRGSFEDSISFREAESLELLCALRSRPEGNSAEAFEDTDRLADFFCSLARCCGRASHDDGFQHLQSLALRLMSLPYKAGTSFSTEYLAAIIVRGIEQFTEQTGSSIRPDFEEQMQDWLVEQGLGSMKTPMKTPRDKRTQSGFRWEEGICEWVAATPASLLQKRKVRIRRPVNKNESVQDASTLPRRVSVDDRRGTNLDLCDMSALPHKRNLSEGSSFSKEQSRRKNAFIVDSSPQSEDRDTLSNVSGDYSDTDSFSGQAIPQALVQPGHRHVPNKRQRVDSNIAKVSGTKESRARTPDGDSDTTLYKPGRQTTLPSRASKPVKRPWILSDDSEEDELSTAENYARIVTKPLTARAFHQAKNIRRPLNPIAPNEKILETSAKHAVEKSRPRHYERGRSRRKQSLLEYSESEDELSFL